MGSDLTSLTPRHPQPHVDPHGRKFLGSARQFLATERDNGAVGEPT